MADKKSTDKARKRLPTEERREEIVKAAMELVAEHDVDSVTTDDMAKKVGVTQGAIFRHFPNKEAIWEGTVKWLRKRLSKVLEEAAAQATDPMDALERMFSAHLGFVSRHPGLPKLIFSDQLLRKSPRLKTIIQEILRGYEDIVAGHLREAQAQGLVRDDVDPEAGATLFVGMIQGLVIQSSVLGYKEALGEESKRVFRVYLTGIDARQR